MRLNTQKIYRTNIQQIWCTRPSTLGPNDIPNFFNELFKSLNINIVLTPQHSYEGVKSIYPNFTTAITRDELFIVFKAIIWVCFFLSQSQCSASTSSSVCSYNTNMMGNSILKCTMTQLCLHTILDMQPGQNFEIAQNLLR